jgi:aspartokinase
VVQDTGRNVAYVIEKQYPVMSADPRLVTGATVVPEMTYDFAMEAFGNVHGADGGAIHPEALAMLAHTDIDTFVLNPETAAPENITHIHRFDPEPDGIEMAAVRPIPTALQVRSTKMFNRPGFLQTMSQWFADRGISVDQIFSSEVTISFTFTNGGVGDPVIAQFRQFLEEQYADDELELNVLRDRAALYCMGNNIAGVAPLAQMMKSLEIGGVKNIDFLTRGARESIIAIVDRKHAAAALASLHSECIH